ncbi:MAG: LysR family transcriptional regulator [bacterium]
MEIQQLKVALALVTESSMIGAAERLGVSQPAISASLNNLERELGVILFHRSRTGLRLTESGKLLLPFIKQFLQSESDIASFFKQSNPEAGTIRVAGRQGFMEYVFPDLFNILQKKYPLIKIATALSGNQDEVVEALQAGRADIGFASSPGIKSIVAEVMHHDPIRLAVASGHKLAKKRNVSKNDLSQLAFCIPEKKDRLRQPIERFLSRLGKNLKIVTETNDYTLTRNIITTSECAGFLYSHMFVNPEARKTLVNLKIADLNIYRDLTILHRRDDLSPQAETARKVFIYEGKRILTKYAS